MGNQTASAAIVAGASVVAVAHEIFQPRGSALSGASSLSGNGQVGTVASGLASGAGSLASSRQVVIRISSGTAQGVGTLLQQNIVTGTGVGAGSSSISGTSKIVHSGRGSVFGRSLVFDRLPTPIYGLGTITGFAEVVRIPPPVSCQVLRDHPFPNCHVTDCGVCHWIRMLPPWIPRDRAHIDMFMDPAGIPLFPNHCRCRDRCEDQEGPPFPGSPVTIPCPPKHFRWGHEFVFGDLTFNLATSSGKAFSPYSVTWTMFRLLPGGGFLQAGPTQMAVQQRVGLFYAVGVAGENGQPGDWFIRWTYVRFFGGSEVSFDEPFRVVDAVLDPLPWDRTCRVQKFGWD